MTACAAERGNGLVKGSSAVIRAVDAAIHDLAQSEVPLLLLAEPGAGKKTAAVRIHQNSSRNGCEFHALNAAQLGPESVDSVEGPFAGRGTVYLEAVNELSPVSQLKLLEILSGAELGVELVRTMRARLICGSNTDLDAQVRSGHFRDDLYYRIAAVSLRLPPLRQRKEDIPLLARHFFSRFADSFGRPEPLLSEEMLHLFEDYAWPGNIRELEDVARALVVLGSESVAMRGMLAALKSGRGGNGKPMSLKEAAKAASREAERELVLRALTRTRWNRRRAAEELNISYKSLLYKLKQIGYDEVEAS